MIHPVGKLLFVNQIGGHVCKHGVTWAWRKWVRGVYFLIQSKPQLCLTVPPLDTVARTSNSIRRMLFQATFVKEKPRTPLTPLDMPFVSVSQMATVARMSVKSD